MSGLPALMVALAVAGLIVGSFANVVIYRLPRRESLVSPPSHCPRCGARIRARDNIPVLSWLLLKARCRDCGSPIPVRYPLVEAATGGLWVLAGVLFGASVKTVFAVVFFSLLLILAVIDLDTYRLPNPLVGTLAAVGLAGIAVSELAGARVLPLLGEGRPVLLAVIGVALGAGVSFALALVYEGVRGRQGFGMGDVKLLAAIGLFVGPYAAMVLFLGSVLGALAGIGSALRSGGGLQRKMPFGPFLAAAAVIVTAYGPAFWDWYSGLIA